jgi:uncharacterized protein (DUF486 family)
MEHSLVRGSLVRGSPRSGSLVRAYVILLIFIGSVSYTVAAYYHLRIEKWTFLKAFAIALPLILIEYQFSIRGNHHAHDTLKMNAVQITLLTMAFYFINAWVLNKFILKKHAIVWWREIAVFILLVSAVVLSAMGTTEAVV